MGVNTMKGTRLKELRERRGETQSQLAEFLDVSQQAVGKWELDKASPDDKTLIKVAIHYGVTIDYLLGFDNSPQYFHDPETASLLQDLKDNPDYRAMLDSARGLKPESVKEVMAFIKYQKAKEEGL